MSARLFRSIKNILSSSPKAIFLSLFFLSALFIKTDHVFAQAAATAQSDYANYLNLFDGGQSGLSIPSAGDLVQDATTQNVTGLKLNITLDFSSNDSGALSSRWDHVYDDTSFNDSTGGKNDSFLIRVCDINNPGNCWVNTVPYNGRSSDFNLITKKDKNGDWRNPILVSNFPLLYSTTVNNGGYVQVQNGVLYKYTQNLSGNKNEGTISPLSSVILKPSSTVSATLWYCADTVAKEADGSKAYQTVGNVLSDKIATFGTLCGGKSYFRVGEPVVINIPATATAIAGQVNNQQATTGGSTNKDNLPDCGVIPGVQHGTINGCAAQLAYGVYWLTAWIAGLFGGLFDFFIGYSLSDASYRFTFAVTGWKLVRDISNVFFIIIMVWTGFSAVFNTSKTSMKSVVPNLIINALLINFSLFATRVVIDISNITARMFYSQMIVCEQVNLDANGNCPPAQAKRGWGGYWPLSEKILSAFNPQTIFKTSILQPPSDSSNTSAGFNAQTAGTTAAVSARDYATYFGIVCLIAAFIMVFVTIMFFRVTFLFVGRVIGLYICMIFSPFAFLSRDMPMLSGLGRLRWNSWTEELTNYAMLAPIFLFFLYIIYIFLSSNFVQQVGFKDPSGSFFGTVLAIVIPMLLIFYLLQAAQKAAESYAGDIGKSTQKFLGSVTGLAVGAATGGAALAGARVFGGAAKKVDESRVGTGIRNLAARGGALGWTGRKLQQGLNATRSASFDVRQSTPGKEFFNRLGIDTNQKALNVLAPVGLGLGTDQRKGGVDADIKRRVEDHEKDAKLLEEKSGEAIKAYNDKYKAKYDKEITTIIEKEMLKTHTEAEIATAKAAPDQTQYNQWKNEATTAASGTINAVTPPVQIRSADELTSARREQYSKNLKSEGFLAKSIKDLAEKGGGFEKLAGVLEKVAAVGSVAGMITGSQVRAEGDKVAAKKIDEKNKIGQELQKLEETLQKGFRDLISVEMFQKNYDKLQPTEKAQVDARQAAINTDKKEKERWAKRVEAVELSKYDLKKEKERAKNLKNTMLANATPANINAYFDQLDIVEEATKHEKIWRDLAKYREDQKKKMKGEEPAK